MKFYNVDQQSFVYKEAMYKGNDKFKLNVTPSIYNKCYCPQQASGVGVVKTWLIIPVVSAAVNVRVEN